MYIHHPTSHPDLEVKALKIYSPDGPRNGVIVTFSTQSAKGLWLAKISEVIQYIRTVVLGISMRINIFQLYIIILNKHLFKHHHTIIIIFAKKS